MFGSLLQSARTAFIPLTGVSHCADNGEIRVLVVGDGDGRFLRELLLSHSRVIVDYVDCSPGMLELARSRVSNDPRVHWHCMSFADFPTSKYDVVAAHFFLDGFARVEQKLMLDKLVGSLEVRGVLLVSDFDENAHLGARALVRLMQFFFYIVAQLPNATAVRHDTEFELRGLKKDSETLWWRGTIFSQMWKM